MSDVTRILSKIESGDQQASEELLPLVYNELRKLAAARMANERPDHTLQATALVHEAYVRLVDVKTVKKWDSRGHFFAAAAEAMRRILIESARSKSSSKRGGDLHRAQDLDLGLLADRSDATWPEQLLEVDAALEQLRVEDPHAAELVRLRLYAGLSIRKAAEVLGIPKSTAADYWRFARAWIAMHVGDESSPSS